MPKLGNDFMKLSVQAMDTLNQHYKSNVVYNMAKIVALKRPNSEESLIALNRTNSLGTSPVPGRFLCLYPHKSGDFIV